MSSLPSKSLKNKIPLIIALTFATGAILFSTIYLPFYSNIQSHRNDFDKNKLLEMQSAGRKVSASMWKNMDNEIKSKKLIIENDHIDNDEKKS